MVLSNPTLKCSYTKYVDMCTHLVAPEENIVSFFLLSLVDDLDVWKCFNAITVYITVNGAALKGKTTTCVNNQTNKVR